MSFASHLFPEPWDKVAHVIVFALLTWMLFRAFGARAALLAATVAVCVGGADEIHQAFLVGRTSDLADFCADGIGAAVTALVLRRDRAGAQQLESATRSSDSPTNAPVDKPRE